MTNTAMLQTPAISSVHGSAGASAARPGISRPLAETGDFKSPLIACLIIAFVGVLLPIYSEQYQHWFLIPISACGILVAVDFIDWARGRIDLYDPLGILSFLGLFYFYFAPLLHVAWDTWTDVSPPPDWRDWLGYMGILNAVGLILFHIGRRVFKRTPYSTGKFWQIDKARFRIVLPLCILLSTAAQTAVYAKFGGITGYMDSLKQDPAVWVGMGPLFMFSESAPILLAFFLVLHLQQRRVKWSVAMCGLAGLFLVQLYFGGLRGSRSETVQLFFWVVGCIHLLVRPVPRKLVYAGLAFLMVFLYLYNFYKAMGKDAMEAITASADDREYLARTKHKTFKGMVLFDLARADLQAYIVFRLLHDGEDFDYAKGRTYLASLSIWIPRWILPNRPLGKIKEGTEIQIGSGFDENNVSSHVYGMAAEAMLNFGILAAPLFYGLFGLFMGGYRRALQSLLPGDARLLLAPLGAYMCLAVLLGDSDNMAFGLAKNGGLPFLVVALCSKKLRYVRT